MTEDQIRDLLREMRDEPVPADSLVRVRLGIARRMQTRSWPSILWRVAGAVVATACVVLAVFWLRETKPVAPPSPPAIARKSEEAKPLAPDRGSLIGERRLLNSRGMKSRVRRQPPASTAGDNVIIRIETPDPDVVILLIGEE